MDCGRSDNKKYFIVLSTRTLHWEMWRPATTPSIPSSSLELPGLPIHLAERSRDNSIEFWTLFQETQPSYPLFLSCRFLRQLREASYPHIVFGKVKYCSLCLGWIWRQCCIRLRNNIPTYRLLETRSIQSLPPILEPLLPTQLC